MSPSVTVGFARFWAADSFRDTKAIQCRVNRAFCVPGQLQDGAQLPTEYRLCPADLAYDRSYLHVFIALFLAGYDCIGHLPESGVCRVGASFVRLSTEKPCAIHELRVAEGLFVCPYTRKNVLILLRRVYLPFRLSREAPSTAILGLGLCLLGTIVAAPSSGLPTKRSPRAHVPSPLPGGSGGTL